MWRQWRAETRFLSFRAPRAYAPAQSADDDRGVRKAFERVLRAAGYRVASFGSCLEFLASLENRAPDCVLLDVHMPEMSGIEMLSKLPLDHHRVIVFSASENPEFERLALEAGAGYVRKPIDCTLLVNAVHDVCRASSR